MFRTLGRLGSRFRRPLTSRSSCNGAPGGGRRAQSPVERGLQQAFALLQQQGQSSAQSMQSAHVAPLAATPLEHALQAAEVAREAEMSSEVVIAALFHECGHLVPKGQGSRAGDSASTGRADLHRLGSTWLWQHGFSRIICSLIASHGETRRYLCHKDPGYYDDLSDLAKADLSLHGGAMTPTEADAFEACRSFNASLALRHCCDTAALQDERPAAGLEHYKAMVEEHLGEALAERSWWEDLGELGTYHVKR